jgi:hypothetical protein
VSQFYHVACFIKSHASLKVESQNLEKAGFFAEQIKDIILWNQNQESQPPNIIFGIPAKVKKRTNYF